jgi:hypothetical protein
MKMIARSFCVVLFATSLVGCCTIPSKSAKEIEGSHEIILPRYLKYVEADAALDAAQKDDQKKLVESLKRIVTELKKATE